MNKKQAILFVFLLLIFNIQGKAQVNFRIILDNYSDSSVLLTSYFGNKIKLVDTATIHEGVFTFSNTSYPDGMYMLASPSKNKLFEFIINNESGFTIYYNVNTTTPVKADGSLENKLFFKHLQLRNDIYRQAIQMNDKLSNKGTQTYQIEKAEAKLDSLKKALEQEEMSIISSYPGLFITQILIAGKEIKIPLSIAGDSLQSYLYYKEHFWDGIPLEDERFLRTPIIDQKLQAYFDHVIFLDPDSTIAAIETVISLARPSNEVVSYILWYLIVKYQNPQYMGFDAVFVHLVDQYLLKEEVMNTTPSILEKLKETSDNLKPLLIGMPAPDLVLMDTNDRFVSFRELDSEYTLLLFWDINCDICKDEIEGLQLIIDTTSYNIIVYAINTNNDLNRWKHTIKARNMRWINVNGTHSITSDFHKLYDISGTPRMFLLDREKKIMAKHFKVEQLILIIENQFLKNKH